MNTLTSRPSASLDARPLRDIEFYAWLGQASPGERLEYHLGFLAMETATLIVSAPERSRLIALAAAAHRAYEADLVHLVQRRLGPDRFAYLAIARTKPRRMPVPLARLLEDAEAA